MFKEINIGVNVNSESDEIILKEIKKIIHKNTTLNSKNGKVVNRYEKDGDYNTTRKGKRKRSPINEIDDINTLMNMISSRDNVDNKIPDSNEDEDSDDGESGGDSDYEKKVLLQVKKMKKVKMKK